MIVRNMAKTTKTIVSNGNSFPGTVEGRTYTATEDNQLLRLWGNIVIPSLTGGYICSAVIEDVQGRVEPTSDDVTFSGGSAITKNLHLWSKGLLMGAGAKGPARMPRNLLGRRLDCPSDGRRQLLRQGYGNLLALISLGVAA